MKFKFSHRRKKSILGSWLISYIVIALIPFFCGLIIYIQSNHTLKEQANKTADYISYHVSKNTEDILVSTRNLYGDITLHSNLQDVIQIKDTGEYLRNEQVHKFLKRIKEDNTLLNELDFFYIWLEETDTVISPVGVMRAGDFYDIYMKNSSVSYELWKEGIRDAASINQYVSLGSFGDFNDVMVYTVYLPVGNSKNNRAYLSVITEKERFIAGIEDGGKMDFCSIFLYNKSGDLFMSKKGEQMKESFERLSDIKKVKGKIVTLNSVAYETINVQIATLVSEDAILENRRVFYFLAIFSFFMTIIISAGLILSLVRKRYAPILKIFKILGIQQDRYAQNEYEMIEEAIENTIRSGEKLAVMYEQKDEKLLKYIMARNLQYEAFEVFAKDYLEKIKFNYRYYAIIVFEIEELDDMFQPDENLNFAEKYTELSFIMSNIYEELLSGDKMRACMIETGDFFTCVVNMEQMRIEEIHNIVRQGIDVINQNFKVKITYTLAQCDDVANIHSAYSNALKLMEHKMMFGEEETMIYEELNKSSNNGYYIYTLETEECLLNAIKRGNSDVAIKVIDKVFEEVGKHKEMPLEYVKCLMLDVAASLLKIPGEIVINDDRIYEICNPEKILEHCESIKNIYSYIRHVVEEICCYVEDEKNQGHARLSEKIVEYIRENYTDPNLNVSTIAENFNFVAPYISKIFRDYNGKSIPDFLNSYRLERAKELMVTSDHTINEIAEMSGFGHIRTFNRIFKKIEGITPREYMNKKNF